MSTKSDYNNLLLGQEKKKEGKNAIYDVQPPTLILLTLIGVMNYQKLLRVSLISIRVLIFNAVLSVKKKVNY